MTPSPEAVAPAPETEVSNPFADDLALMFSGTVPGPLKRAAEALAALATADHDLNSHFDDSFTYDVAHNVEACRAAFRVCKAALRACERQARETLTSEIAYIRSRLAELESVGKL